MLALPVRPWSSLCPMGEFVECGDSPPHSSESGDESPHGSQCGDELPHSTLGGLNDDQGPLPVKASLDTVVGLTGY